jgi:hypothetical protein
MHHRKPLFSLSRIYSLPPPSRFVIRPRKLRLFSAILSPAGTCQRRLCPENAPASERPNRAIFRIVAGSSQNGVPTTGIGSKTSVPGRRGGHLGATGRSISMTLGPTGLICSPPKEETTRHIDDEGRKDSQRTLTRKRSPTIVGLSYTYSIDQAGHFPAITISIFTDFVVQQLFYLYNSPFAMLFEL